MSEPTIASSAPRDATGRTQPVSRELSSFLVELAVAMHKHAIYPRAHPLVGQAVDAVFRSAATLLAGRPAISIGVARRQLIVEGVATGSTHPLLADLASALHRHHIGALKFTHGLTRVELSSFLEVFGVEAQRGEMPLGLQKDLADAQWNCIKVFPLAYERLGLLDDDDWDAIPAERGTGSDMSRAAQLWVGLANAAAAASEEDDGAMEPESVAAAIEEHDREPAYDQVIVGYLLQIAREVQHGEFQSHSAGLTRRVSRLVGSLDPDTLRQLLEMGGDGAQRREFVLDASRGMSVDAVVDLVQAAARAEGQTISSSLLRMLNKLAAHASRDETPKGRLADSEFREHVQRLVSSWSLDDPNPLAYSSALEQMSRGRKAQSDAENDSRHPCEPTRVIAMALELDCVTERLTPAISAALRANQLADLLDLLDSAPPTSIMTIEHVWTLVDASAPLAALLLAPQLDHALIRRVLERARGSAAPILLAALGEATEESRRERLIDYATSLGANTVRVIASRLPGAAPRFARDLMQCLSRIAPATLPPAVRPFLAHQDPLVRRDAVKLLLSYDESREATLVAAMKDEDERVVYGALLAWRGSWPAAAIAILRQRMDHDEFRQSATRAAAIRAVAGQGDDGTLEWLLDRVPVRGGVMRRTRIAAATTEVLAALEVIATEWRDHPAGARILRLAGRSANATIRATAIPREHE